MTLDLDNIPQETGVYLMKDSKGTVLYVGKAKKLKNRVKQYFSRKGDERIMTPFLLSKTTDIETIITLSEKDALILETNLIKQHQPKYNILLKDDKSFIHLMINLHHRWPMLRLIRYRGAPKKDRCHFGPYTNAFAARQTIDLMARLFRLRQCSDRELTMRTRPCLLYSIKKCLAPCVAQCTKKEYGLEVKHAIEFLKGKNKHVITQLKKKMKQASQNMEYEKAEIAKKTIDQIEHIISPHSVIRSKRTNDCDVFALEHKGKYHVVFQLLFRKGRLVGTNHFKFMELASDKQEIWETFLVQHYQKISPPPEVLLPCELKCKNLLEELLSIKVICPSKGEQNRLVQLAKKNAKAFMRQVLSKEELLLDVQETCGLNHCPVHIECFDISSLSGTDLVACMVRFSYGERDRSSTRLFKVKDIQKSDDYSAIKEVLMRHYSKAQKNDTLPDLALIDGGKGHLQIAVKIFQELGIVSVDLIALAKERARHDKGLNSEKIFVVHKRGPILLPPRSSVLLILQQMRDEAHRIAISFHLKRRSKRLIQTQLENIPGIGSKKSILLLKHFGSVERVKKGAKQEFAKIKGLSKANLEAIEKFQREE